MRRHFRIWGSWFLIIGGIILFAGLGQAQGVDYQQQMKEVTEHLVCLCGCGNQIMYSCTCGEARQNREFVLSQLKAGKSKQEVIDIMVKRYGERVLAAPKREGINWIMWVVVPYIVPVLGAIGIAFLVMRWAGQRKIKGAGEVTESESDSAVIDKDDEYRQKLGKELKDFE
jgi:cytochrome c-type biogenesis protein CcmH